MGEPCRHHFCEVETFNFVPGSVAVYADGGRSLVIGIWTFGDDNVSKCRLRNFGFFSTIINTGLFSSDLNSESTVRYFLFCFPATVVNLFIFCQIIRYISFGRTFKYIIRCGYKPCIYKNQIYMKLFYFKINFKTCINTKSVFP